jgi:hypothetical protein
MTAHLSEKYMTTHLSEKCMTAHLSEKYMTTHLSEKYMTAHLSEKYITSHLSEKYIWLGINTSIKSGCAKLVLWDKIHRNVQTVICSGKYMNEPTQKT